MSIAVLPGKTRAELRQALVNDSDVHPQLFIHGYRNAFCVPICYDPNIFNLELINNICEDWGWELSSSNKEKIKDLILAHVAHKYVYQFCQEFPLYDPKQFVSRQRSKVIKIPVPSLVLQPNQISIKHLIQRVSSKAFAVSDILKNKSLTLIHLAPSCLSDFKGMNLWCDFDATLSCEETMAHLRLDSIGDLWHYPQGGDFAYPLSFNMRLWNTFFFQHLRRPKERTILIVHKPFKEFKTLNSNVDFLTLSNLLSASK